MLVCGVAGAVRIFVGGGAGGSPRGLGSSSSSSSLSSEELESDSSESLLSLATGFAGSRADGFGVG